MNSLIAIFTNPRAVFDEQRDDPKWLLPGLVILAFTIIAGVAVTMLVDMEEVTRAQIEQTIETLERQGMPQAAIDEVRASSEQQVTITGNPIVAIGSSILGAVVIFFILSLVHALYFMIVGKIMSTGHDFSDWFALSVWGRMPWIVAAIVTVVAALVMSPQTDLSAYNLLALSSWMNMPNENHMIFGTLVKTLDLMVIWSIVIMTIGFDSWTEKGIGVSLAVVAVPYVIVYGLLMVL
ncbi:MAG: YIP1 family protein [Gammaproteobacteria bacterium]|nr:YIP1 family protein [Gammaproteobacteria bacterium]